MPAESHRCHPRRSSRSRVERQIAMPPIASVGHSRAQYARLANFSSGCAVRRHWCGRVGGPEALGMGTADSRGPSGSYDARPTTEALILETPPARCGSPVPRSAGAHRGSPLLRTSSLVQTRVYPQGFALAKLHSGERWWLCRVSLTGFRGPAKAGRPPRTGRACPVDSPQSRRERVLPSGHLRADDFFQVRTPPDPPMAQQPLVRGLLRLADRNARGSFPTSDLVGIDSH